MATTTVQTIGPYTVRVTRKRIKNLYLRVLPEGGVSVHAPLHTADAEIVRFVLGRADWIDRQARRLAAAAPCNCGDGDEIPYFGKRLTLRVREQAGRTRAALRGDTIELFIRGEADEAARKKAMDAWYRAALYEAAGAMLPGIERTVGKRAGELKVRDMKTRWGSCNTKTAHITLNLRLAQKPAECLRYVLTHELCHLHEAGHGAAFWARMDLYFPDWRRVRKLLRQGV